MTQFVLHGESTVLFKSSYCIYYIFIVKIAAIRRLALALTQCWWAENKVAASAAHLLKVAIQLLVGYADAGGRYVAVLRASIRVRNLILLPLSRDNTRLTALGKVRTVFGVARWELWRDSGLIFAESLPIAFLPSWAVSWLLRLAQSALQLEVVARLLIASTAAQLILACMRWLNAMVRRILELLLLSTRRLRLLSGLISVCLRSVQSSLGLFRLLAPSTKVLIWLILLLQLHLWAAQVFECAICPAFAQNLGSERRGCRNYGRVCFGYVLVCNRHLVAMLSDIGYCMRRHTRPNERILACGNYFLIHYCRLVDWNWSGSRLQRRSHPVICRYDRVEEFRMLCRLVSVRRLLFRKLLEGHWAIMWAESLLRRRRETRLRLLLLRIMLLRHWWYANSSIR